MSGFPTAHYPTVTRRRFCRSALSAATGLAVAKLLSATDSANDADLDLASFERARVLAAAKQYLREQPVTLTNFSSPRSAGGKHDYFSEGDYWWPDPKDPDGPYIQRDGMSNPDNFVAHRHALIRLGVQVPALTAACLLTRNKEYSTHAVKHLRAWFLDPETLMNPNLQYAQAIHGRTTGRGTGIIDTIHLVEVARSIPFLIESKALSPAEFEALRKWFAQYLEWMTTSKNGQDEKDAKNNHGTWWVTQVAQFATFTENQKLTTFCADRFKTVLVPHQIAPDGSLPEELRRTKPYNYCLFNLSGLATICQALSTPQDSLFTFSLPDGRGFGKSMAWVFPYIANKSSWPYRPDVEYFQYWPIRQPDLLFAGLAFSNQDYVQTWKHLPPEPQVEEIIRNNPIRQPLLWVKTSRQ
ncbi:MAG TPA: alginate lyase family protein [Terriglobales bacterium]|nr:alginate lyase family protein [Terriglobales bacterium]